MNKVLFEGVAVALITPFKKGKIDFKALKDIIEFHIEGGIKTFVVLGTTGEPATMTSEEKQEVIKFAKKTINGRALMLVGTGGYNTVAVIEVSLIAKKLGADGLLIVTPYYNKCTQKGLIEHYNAIAEAVKMPIIAYNVPGRTGVNINPSTAAELAKNPYIVGFKEASGNISQIISLFKALDGKMAIYSGDDSINYVFMTLGAKGFISVTANVLPKEIVQLYNIYTAGKISEALAVHQNLLDINHDLFCEVNPIPIKAAAHHLGLCSDEMRLPLTTIEDINRKKLIETFDKILK